MMKKVLIVSMMFALGACSSKDQPNIELVQDMMETPAVKPQREYTFFSDGIGSRVPPENTVPVGFAPYKYATNPDGAKGNRNPMAGDSSPETLMTGQKYYETHCTVCHGTKLAGDGPLAAKMPLKPPPLSSDKIRGWTDGQIYHVITVGQGVMGPYASHVPQPYRWQVVNYIRYLQKNVK